MLNKVKEYRKKRGMTQAQLAERANICRPYLSAIESGKQTRISNVVMFQIARALQEPIDNIFFMQLCCVRTTNKGGLTHERDNGTA